MKALIPACLLTFAIGCGGGGKSQNPTAPTPAAIPAPPSGLTIGTVTLRERTVPLTWAPSPGATAYVIEVGSASGASDVAVITTSDANASNTLSGVRVGRSYARVKASNAVGVSGPSGEVNFFVADFQDYIEAIFLDSGPVRAIRGSGDACILPGGGRLIGFPRGSTVRARIWTAISGGNRAAIEDTLGQVSDATGGAINTAVESTDESNPSPRDNEIVFGSIENDPRCPLGCARPSYISPGVLRWVRALFTRAIIDSGNTAPFAHETAHAALGMCHVNSDGIGGDQNSIMATRPGGTRGLPSRLTPWDVEVTKAVYNAGLNPGTTRDAFSRAGLVK